MGAIVVDRLLVMSAIARCMQDGGAFGWRNVNVRLGYVALQKDGEPQDKRRQRAMTEARFYNARFPMTRVLAHQLQIEWPLDRNILQRLA